MGGAYIIYTVCPRSPVSSLLIIYLWQIDMFKWGFFFVMYSD